MLYPPTRLASFQSFRWPIQPARHVQLQHLHSIIVDITIVTNFEQWKNYYAVLCSDSISSLLLQAEFHVRLVMNMHYEKMADSIKMP